MHRHHGCRAGHEGGPLQTAKIYSHLEVVPPESIISFILDLIPVYARSNVGDDGAAAIAEVLRLGGADVKLAFLELLDDNIGARV